MAAIGRPAPTAGALVAVVGTGLALGALALTILNWNSPPPYPLSGISLTGTLATRTLVQTVGLVTLSAVSAVIVWRRPRSRLSWVLVATMLTVAATVFTAEYAVRGLVVDPLALPLADVAAWTQVALPDLIGLGAVTAILLFPDGLLMSRRWILLLGLAVIVFGAHLVAALDQPYAIWVGLILKQPVPVTMPPLLWPVGSSLSWASGALTWAEAGIDVAAGVAVLLRLTRARGDSRLQMTWFAYAAALYCLMGILAYVNLLPVPDWLPFADFPNSDVARAIAGWSGVGAALAGLVIAPAAIAVAMLRYRLYDINIVISKTIIYGGLALFVTGSYAIVVGGVGGMLGQRGILNPVLSVLTIALLAVLLLPVHARLTDLADVAVYGKRAKPYDVLSDFAESIGRAEPAEVLLPRMAELLRLGTGAAKTEVWAKVGDRLQLAASSPAERVQPAAVLSPSEIPARFTDPVFVEPVYQDGQVLGALVVAKPPAEELNTVERRLFRDLASQAGLVLVRFRLVQELLESRSRIVASQDTERRRIERNLHDGAQQRFVNALLALGMAQLEDNHRNGRGELILEASREVQAGLNELRSLARGLEPPLLAESGIVAAVAALADSSPIPTRVVADTEDLRYGQGIETAAYFVVAESLTNAIKHSRAKEVVIAIHEAADRISIEIRDDGLGGADASRGSGIIGLQDRVAAIGGTLTVASRPGGGTAIKAELPCK